MKKLFVLFVLLLAASPAVFGAEVKSVDKDGLKAMLGNSDLVIFDVRAGKDWSSSEFKIKNAVRLTSETTAAAMSTISKDKTLVFYCA
jgi:rhodanese-related sulfurtransferase